MITKIERAGAGDIYRRSGDASYYFEMEVLPSKRVIRRMGYSANNVSSRFVIHEPLDLFLWVDDGSGGKLRLVKSMLNPGEENDEPLNTFVEGLLLTAIFNKAVIPKAKELKREGLYYDLRSADLLSEFDIDGMARFLAGLGVVKNSVTLADGSDVELTKLAYPSSQPSVTQLEILTLEPLWNLIEGLCFYGILPYVWTFGLISFKEFCYRVGRYWPEREEREQFVFDELAGVLLSKRAPSLTEVQVDVLMNEPINI